LALQANETGLCGVVCVPAPEGNATREGALLRRLTDLEWRERVPSACGGWSPTQDHLHRVAGAAGQLDHALAILALGLLLRRRLPEPFQFLPDELGLDLVGVELTIEADPGCHSIQ